MTNCRAIVLAGLISGCSATGTIEDGPRGKIELGSGTIDPRTVEPADRDATRAADGSGQYLIVQLEGPANAAALDALSADVESVYGYLPDDAFLVRVGRGQEVAGLGSWAGVYRPEYKVASALRDAADEGGDELQTILVQTYPEADLDRVADEVAGFSEAELVGSGSGARFSRVRVQVPGDRAVAVAEALAGLSEVAWVDVEGQRALFNDTTIWVGQSGVSGGRTTPIFDRGIHGEGQIVGMIDNGIDADSCFFRDTARGLPAQNLCDGGTKVDLEQRKIVAVDFLHAPECAGGIANNEWDSTASHGTHTAGTFVGDNFAQPILHDAADGMAPGAKLVVQDAGTGTDACGSMPGLGCPMVDLKPFFEQAYAQGARIHSNSWGDQQNTIPHNKYTAASEDVDEFMWAHPDFLLFFAAGNAGSNPGTVASPSTAKNAISVGATLHAQSAEGMAPFSGCGPTADGRVKPDLTIPGAAVVSARSDGNVISNNCSTVGLSGTSQATPAAAGLGALVRQYYTDGFYPSGTRVPEDGFVPSAALVKATMVSSARQMTAAAAGPIPGNCQGWGRVLLEDALFFDGQVRRLFATDDPGFVQGGIGLEKRFVFVVRPNESLKATLTWTDFPSTPAAAINLVNDLDLEVSGPAGTFLGNVFALGQSLPGGEPDRRNTVEQVLLALPLPGVYTITVRAFNVPVGPQPFALVVAGDATPNKPPTADAGPDQTGVAGQPIGLDGTGSSDPDEIPEALSFAWTQIDGPTVELGGADTARPGFTASALGSYTFRLVVSDGAAQAEDTVTVTIVNQPPVADAGDDSTGVVGAAVTLDGTGSSDPDQAPSALSFAWTQTDGPPVDLGAGDGAQASFTPTALGTYTFSLAVNDGLAGSTDTVSVTILNQAPVADAGPDLAGPIGQEVVLDGSGSIDPDGVPGPLAFAWTQTDGPPTAIQSPDASQARFTPDEAGTYTFRLVVGDGEAEAEDTVTVTITNDPPTANAGPDRTGAVGAPTLLDGSGSADPDQAPSPLSFAWVQTGGPSVGLVSANESVASFTPSVSGTYTFSLTVSDGVASSNDTVVVTVPTATVGVFSDDFEANRGWTTNPSGADTATTGRWERATPQATFNGSTPMQLTARGGVGALVTGASAGASVGVNDIDEGITSIRSPEIDLPAGAQITLSVAFYLAHLNNATADDFVRVRVVGATTQTVVQELGDPADDAGVWQTATVNISAFAGQRVRILVEAADAGTASLVEAAIDDLVIQATL